MEIILGTESTVLQGMNKTKIIILNTESSKTYNIIIEKNIKDLDLDQSIEMLKKQGVIQNARK